MDNQETLQQSSELPIPVGDKKTTSSAEFAGAGELAPTGASAPIDPATAAMAVSAAQTPTPGSAAPQSSASIATAHLSAADVDLIEKEWVQKAKDIVSATHGDPFAQNKEINKIKADYIKKRYNKDIKVASE